MDFHVGNYVELLSGEIGYIRKVSSSFDVPDGYGMVITINLVSPKSKNGTDMVLEFKSNESIYDRFAPIGCKRLPKAKALSEPIKTINLAGAFLGATERMLAQKVDELVKAVNKINEQLAKER